MSEELRLVCLKRKKLGEGRKKDKMECSCESLDKWLEGLNYSGCYTLLIQTNPPTDQLYNKPLENDYPKIIKKIL